MANLAYLPVLSLVEPAMFDKGQKQSGLRGQSKYLGGNFSSQFALCDMTQGVSVV